MDAQLSIGAFSRMTFLSVKALRHYHEIGLLAPASIDLGMPLIPLGWLLLGETPPPVAAAGERSASPASTSLGAHEHSRARGESSGHTRVRGAN